MIEPLVTFGVVVAIVAVIALVALADKKASQAKMSPETASAVALDMTSRFSTTRFDTPETIEDRIKAMERFGGTIGNEACPNLRSALKGWLGYHKKRALENMDAATKRAAVRVERRRLGI